MGLARICFLIVFVLLFFAGFSSAQGPEPNTVAITKTDNGKEFTVAKDAIFEVRLERSGGTGYLWQIVEPDETYLKVLDCVECPLNKGERRVGGPLCKTWQIKALKTGQFDLRILLYRPWEGAEKAVDSFRVTIKVR